MTSTTTLRARLFIDGEWRPATGETIASFAAATAEDCDAAVRAAERAFPAWSRTAPRARSESGIGREGSSEGIIEYLEEQYIAMNP